ncbi:hypothetical protein [Haladaptatus sp. DYSN1]|uniref:DUF7351 domain-containing protein n=1 Tax=unclassified Haladaptatus TaxID=2622732 RepID=UPI002406E595|nr:hypothetical protein [Haladaptatus sp. DYSN1]
MCKHDFLTAADRHLIAHPIVAAFYYDHGVDFVGHGWLSVQAETIVEQTVLTEDSLSVRFVAEIDGDRLEMTLDCAGPTTTVYV